MGDTVASSATPGLEQAQRPIRVVVGEDHFLVREGIKQALAHDRSIRVVGMAGDGDSLRSVIQREEPDVVLADVRMPPTGEDEGIQVAEWLRQNRPGVRIILISQYAEPIYALRLLAQAGEGRGYLLKDRLADHTDLIAAIKEVSSGGSVVDARVVEQIVRAMEAREGSALSPLSSREREVLAAIAEGKSNGAIAAAFHLSKGAVEKHINSIFQKLDLPNEREVSRRVLATLIFLSGD
jgi:DNA-binding NarL/FixJ family response regulator